MNASVWLVGKRGAFMYVKRGCVNREVTEREDAA